MKIFIEDYKGQTIEYDDDYDKFVCDISIEDKFKTSKRGSLKDLRKEIDQFIKLNLEFKPFTAIWFSGGYSTPKINYVQAIRTDGKLVVSDKPVDGHKSHVGLKDSASLHILNMEVIKGYEEMDNEVKELRNKHRIREKELNAKLVKMDLSKYDLK